MKTGPVVDLAATYLYNFIRGCQHIVKIPLAASLALQVVLDVGYSLDCSVLGPRIEAHRGLVSTGYTVGKV